MSLSDWIIIGAVTIYAVLAAIYMIKNRGNGCNGCCGNCKRSGTCNNNKKI